jgi:cytochrome b6-f complex iron-sulfur subunit
MPLERELPNRNRSAAGTLFSRRDFLTRSGWAMILGGLGAACLSAVRLLFPRVQHSPPTAVTLGPAGRFAGPGVYDEFREAHNLVLVRNEQGFFALRVVCTHLGCIPRWIDGDQRFECPCHGSGFTREGINFEGPAPRPLERLKIYLDAEQQIVVDTAVRYRKERGEWTMTHAFVRYPPQNRRRGQDAPT